MKTLLQTLVILTAIVLVSTSGAPKETQKIVGNYRLVKIITNGQPNTDVAIKTRTMSFKGDNTFNGEITRANVVKPFIQGFFFVENDSMIIMHPTSLNGGQYKIAFAYNYKISGDTLCLKGYWTQNPSEKQQPLLIRNYVDECWVKVNKK